MRIYTVHKEILKELAFTFFLSLISLNFILIMEKVLKLSRLLSVVGASITDMASIILYLQPPILILTLPMSLLVATLLTYGRLNADSELVILRTSGMSFKSISKPVFILGSACFLAGLFVSFYLGPMSMLRLRNIVSEVITQRAPAAIEKGVFTTLFKDVVIFVMEKPDSENMREIFIYDERNKKEPRALMAKEGRVKVLNGAAISLYLKDGYMHMAKDDASTEIFFEGYNLSLSLAAKPLARKNKELTPLELFREAVKTPYKDSAPLFLELHRRLSLPFVCLMLMFLGPPLSLVAGKSGRLGGLTIGFSIFAVFYILLIYGENLAISGKVPHYLGAWAPAVILMVFAIWIFRKESRK